ncbi:MAG: glycogen/starch/alpha-glucan phosphorylase [Clostridia bacterium]|nr:glycogen/starch/alpha-glucan phosphorylase [Clostridia bacterium]
MQLNKDAFIRDYKSKIITMFRETFEEASPEERYLALGALIRDYMAPDWLETEHRDLKEKRKHIYYFSMEFLIGRLLDSALINLGIRDAVVDGLAELGVEFRELEPQEPDAGLGNGGLGRLAACFIDSMASLDIAGTGIGIRYRYGLFRQLIQNGYQVETPDNWLKVPNVWELCKAEDARIVKFGGSVNMNWGLDGRLYVELQDYEPVLAVPYDIPVPGYALGRVNTLRLWSAETENSGFDFKEFSRGDYDRAVENITTAHSISNVLYPDDSTPRGKLLRLKQEYFFTSAGLQDILGRYLKSGGDVREFAQYNAIQINDTHPALAIPELMRLLIDEQGLGWDEAWRITTDVFGYTNHTILAEALEKWPLDMFKKLLPRIYMIVEEINRRFVAELIASGKGGFERVSSMSIIAEGTVKMAHLAIVGSHSVNGVARLHTEILKNKELRNFNEFYPGRFNNKTNGITHRRWLIQANPELTALIDGTIGEGWRTEPNRLAELEAHIDRGFAEEAAAVKRRNKQRLAEYIRKTVEIDVDPDSVFDIQVKRLHMYKRQLLNIFGVMDMYNRLSSDPGADICPRTVIFSAKAFPGYGLAKNTIKLICTVADRINSDPAVSDKLKVIFLPNYDVSLAQRLIPAGDISEQISTASKEASGTGNMKFMMNGAVTLATLDGANVEIREAVGDENIILFGMTSEEVIELERRGGYDVGAQLASDPRLGEIIAELRGGYFGFAAKDEFRPVLDHLLRDGDQYFVLKDFASYVSARDRIDDLYRSGAPFRRMCAMNIARSGRFSSDNTIAAYADEIWHVKHR